MTSLFSTSIEQTLIAWWGKVPRAYKSAFAFALCISVLAFGFEMTNLTLHHDDVNHFFAGDRVGYYLGRFGHAWLHYYGQGGYFMPFLQMIEAILLMAAYGVLVAHFWGVRKAMDMALISAIVCVFPYMAQIYQYNTCMAPYAAAHLLAALAVVLSARATLISVATAAILYVGAFSIYQAVLANAATIFVFWLLSKVLFKEQVELHVSKMTIRSTIAAIISVVAGGLIYLTCVSLLKMSFDSSQGADKAFSFSEGLQLPYAAAEILKGSRSFFFWPENYFPDLLKKIQLLLVAGAAVFCLWVPKRAWSKITAVTILLLATFAPRTVQLLHPLGTYHNLTLTAYALVIAGAVMIINRAGGTIVRNASTLVALVLVGGYVVQCNWISTVGYLNTLAHYATLTEVLARVRSVPDAHWDGKTVAVVGSYHMPSDYPFRRATGVATEFMDASHMDQLARLMRDEVTFLQADQTMPKVLEYAARHPQWPDPASVSVVDGVGVVVLSKE